jgi:Ca2+-dependent lipid-binding protein
VRVISARNLIAADVGGTSDPYVKLWLAGKHSSLSPSSAYSVKRTRVKTRTLCPLWEETHYFRGVNPLQATHQSGELCLCAHVYDKDFVGQDDKLGFVRIPLAQLLWGTDTEAWFSLQATKHGQLHLSLASIDFGCVPVSLSDLDPSGFLLDQYDPTARCAVHPLSLADLTFTRVHFADPQLMQDTCL